MKDEHAVILGSRGGFASAKKLTAAQRKQRASHASQQRKKKPLTVIGDPKALKRYIKGN